MRRPASRLRALRGPRSSAILALVVLVVGSAVAAPAQAGVYSYWTCKTPAGVPTSTEGWSGTTSMTYTSPTNGCAGGGALSAEFAGAAITYATTTGIRWRFDAPTGTRIVDADVFRSWAVNAATDGAGVAVYRDDFWWDAEHVPEYCLAFVGNCSTAHGWLRLHVDATLLAFDAGCYGPAGSTGCQGNPSGRSWQRWHSARLRLRDDTTPTAANPSGTVLDARPLRGVETLTLAAADTGSGVWQGEVRIGDTVVVPRSVVHDNDGRCDAIDVDAADPNEFAWARPCPLATAASWIFDSARVPDGEHTLTATLWDAAGNASTVLSRKVTVRNPRPLRSDNGVGGDPATGRLVPSGKRTRVRVDYGRAVRVQGRVVDAAGRPIAGAQIDVFEQVRRDGAPRRLVGAVTSDARGAYTYRPRAHSNRAVELAYSQERGSTSYRSTQALELQVRAGVTLRADDASIPAFGRVTLRGRVRA